MEAIMSIGRYQPSNFKINQSGYLLLGLLILILVATYALMAAGSKFSEARKREREQELLKVGDSFRKAIGNYYNQTPGAIKSYPPNLEALLIDDRFPKTKRYLRKIYLDPVTQKEGWGTLKAPSGGIMGVFSLSAASPYKTNNFRVIYRHFENKKHYGEWYFVYVPSDQKS